MWDRTQLRPIPRGVIVQLKQRDSEEFHVLGHAEDFVGWQVDQVQFLQFFWSRDVRREEGVEECFVVRPPPGVLSVV